MFKNLDNLFQIDLAKTEDQSVILFKYKKRYFINLWRDSIMINCIPISQEIAMQLKAKRKWNKSSEILNEC